MARTRQVKPNYPHEKEIRALSIPARYCYLLSWCHMSDPRDEDKAKKLEKKVGGVLPYDLFFLKSNIFPEEEIDIQTIIDEIIAQHRYFPFEAEGKQWLWCPTMPKHQTISHPSSGTYPEPPVVLQEDYRSGKLALHQSRVEGVERDNIKDQPSEKLKAALDKVLKDGFNIYKLVGRLKKELGWQQDRMFPEEVLLGVCESYEKSKARINDQWAWFKVAITQESAKYFAAKNIEEHRKLKNQGTMTLAQILEEIARRKK